MFAVKAKPQINMYFLFNFFKVNLLSFFWKTANISSISIASIGLGVGNSVLAQTSFDFDATYDITASSIELDFGVLKVLLTGSSEDAPFGLTQISGVTYSLGDLLTGDFQANTDPTVFGLLDAPLGEITFFGSGDNKLIGSDEITGTINLETLIARSTGIFSITRGEGELEQASGVLSFSEVSQLSLDPNIPLTGVATVSGTFEIQSVPEPHPSITLIGLGVIGSMLLFPKK